MQCRECGHDMVRVGEAHHRCPSCGDRAFQLEDDVGDALQEWERAHPFRDIPNFADAPLFTTDDPDRIEAVLAWAREHPGQPVPRALLDAAAVEEDALDALLRRVVAESGLLDEAPQLAWAYHRTGRMVDERGYANFAPAVRLEYDDAIREWEELPEEKRRAFVASVRALHASGGDVREAFDAQREAEAVLEAVADAPLPPAGRFSLDHLSATEFEELCYDLLKAKGFRNVTWRKGTGKRGSTADRGRDIECTSIHTGPAGWTRTERWFVQCKHQRRAIPPADLQPALAWAESEGADVLLVITSGALSNAAKDHLHELEAGKRRGFRIEAWERPQLEEMVLSTPHLVAKYRIPYDSFPGSHWHDAHVVLLTRPVVPSFDRFLAILDGLDPVRRAAYLRVVDSGLVRPRAGNDAPSFAGARDAPPVPYHEFRRKLLKLRGEVDEGFLVSSILLHSAQWLASMADPAGVADKVAWNQAVLARLEEERRRKGVPERRREEMDAEMEALALKIQELPEETRVHYDVYWRFCEEVLCPAVGFPPGVAKPVLPLMGVRLPAKGPEPAPATEDGRHGAAGDAAPKGRRGRKRGRGAEDEGAET